MSIQHQASTNRLIMYLFILSEMLCGLGHTDIFLTLVYLIKS